MVDRSLESTTRLLAENDFAHFDAHTHNLLTDGHEIYVADFGLAAHADFDLDPAEHAFLRRHRHYDRCYTVTHLVFAVIGNALREPWPACLDYLRSRPGDDHPRLPREAVTLVRRYAAVATIMGGFWQAVIRDPTAPYPADALADALAAASASPA
ncbi:hypothetical protein O7608_30545 [Solwaraspora sp. WMMA2056]|uniref:hypothetical protein n=1 Tax=Solwaraspora sp. WMMA2056 TaxID=3015161 RepID=UPI00259BE291|nr:hypothetical protein [Solwaraspora sp. WMMA2056]WJK40676.1 hypothetical protein O7608_30545 [Solwaraspora sp. WMMA2056]